MRDLLGKLAALLRPQPSEDDLRRERERVARERTVDAFEDQRFQRAKPVNAPD